MAGLVLAKCLLLFSLSAALLSLLGTGASAIGLPQPHAPVNFTIGVQGMVWCKTCRYIGYNANMDASPLKGVEVYLQCRHGPGRLKKVQGASGQGGYFVIQSAQMASFTNDECKVYAESSSSTACGLVDEPAAGEGLPLKFDSFVKHGDGLQALYSVGNFFFRPSNPNKCY
ncbi:non-classical arabinogalactan protein 31-like [Triticum dicoccoides]|uniref:non-classical arabinogalactan protein 31-like n=1 Tax=Triticum dicoccoides TaxID=85692 RepID=UPI000E79B68A|nr:non-classical arabinogalactan protein 31-like [Triticum dicoccoides]